MRLVDKVIYFIYPSLTTISIDITSCISLPTVTLAVVFSTPFVLFEISLTKFSNVLLEITSLPLLFSSIIASLFSSNLAWKNIPLIAIKHSIIPTITIYVICS